MTPSIDKKLHKFANLLPTWTLIPILTLLPNFGGFHRTLQRVRLANRWRLLLRTSDPVPFGTCICSNVETILSWTCHVYIPFEFRTFLGTSILLSTNLNLRPFIFSSPEPKARVSYCHSAPSVVRPSVVVRRRRASSVRKLFTFSTSSPKPLDGFWWNLVGMKYSWFLTSVVVFRPDPPRGGSRVGPK